MKRFGRFGSLVAGFIAALGMATTADASSTYELEGAHMGGYGQHGLYLGPDNWSSQYSGWRNWEWDNVDMTIHNNGDATISGTMTRLGDAWNYSGYNLSWGINIELSDFIFTGTPFSGITGYFDGWEALAMNQSGSGIEWGSLEMTITKPNNLPYTTYTPATGWTGLAMPQQGHPNVAELHYVAGTGLTFDAWYQNPSSNAYWYQVGDTKAKVNPVGGSAPVPEPSAAVVFRLGWAALGASRKRSRANR